MNNLLVTENKPFNKEVLYRLSLDYLKTIDFTFNRKIRLDIVECKRLSGPLKGENLDEYNNVLRAALTGDLDNTNAEETVTTHSIGRYMRMWHERMMDYTSEDPGTKILQEIVSRRLKFLHFQLGKADTEHFNRRIMASVTLLGLEHCKLDPEWTQIGLIQPEEYKRLFPYA